MRSVGKFPTQLDPLGGGGFSSPFVRLDDPVVPIAGDPVVGAASAAKAAPAGSNTARVRHDTKVPRYFRFFKALIYRGVLPTKQLSPTSKIISGATDLSRVS